MSRSALESRLVEASILICCGSGGVGKTTVSAALGLTAARLGRRVMVLTIDPARRLAHALGLRELGNEEARIEAELDGDGELWAMMLDVRSTFDRLIERYASTPEVRDQILSNRYYKSLSSTFAGSQEYMAMEKLYELHEEGRFDLIILDTPPSRNAIDFLDSPTRMSEFFEGSVIQWFLKPYFRAGRLTMKFASKVGKQLLGTVDRVLGMQFLADLSEFFVAFEGMYEGFRERALTVHRLLRDPSCVFQLVASPRSLPLEEAAFFYDALAERHFHFGGFVFNRTHPDYGEVGDEPLTGVVPGRKLLSRLRDNHAHHQALARRDRERISTFLDARPRREPHVVVPLLDNDVHDLDGLDALADSLLTGETVAD